MRNVTLMTAGILGAAALTAGVAFALTAGPKASGPNAPMEMAEISSTQKSAPAGISEDEMQARLADERASVQAAADAKAACERERQDASNTGAVVGGVAGAVIGSQVAGSGAKSEGGVIGGVAGVLAGRQIAKKDHRC